jgi:murein DD-endopeptidase MepM/ murein hydrolase activator NlpD
VIRWQPLGAGSRLMCFRIIFILIQLSRNPDPWTRADVELLADAISRRYVFTTMIKFRNALPPTGRRVFYTLFRLATALGLFLALASCAREEVVPEAFTPNRSHADYTYALEQLGLAGTPIGAAWLQAGNPVENYRGLSLVPLEEFRSFAPDVPDALWFLLEGVRGQRISIEIETESDAGYFADVIAVDSHWDPREDGSGGWDQVGFIPVASAASLDPLPETDSSAPDAAGTSPDRALMGSGRIEFEPRRQRFYLFRLQPRLLEGGDFTIRIRSDASLAWPVRDSDVNDVISVFGADRDGGTRVHHGIDIIAPRGTDILSVSPSRVSRVGERDRGGLTVSLMDEERGLMIYYAHMQQYGEVTAGETIHPGTVLGGVGDTGNALGGPPHLHIGIYDRSWRRPLDPWYFFVPVPELAVSTPSPESYAEMGLIPGSRISAAEDLLLFRQPPGRNPTRISPSRFDDNGNRILPEDQPITRLDWGDPVAISEGEEIGTLVSFRAYSGDGMLGIMRRDRQLLWLPASQMRSLLVSGT